MLTTGAKLGPYEILSPLGAGGMGEVYKARDTRLDRTVAIKVLPSHLSSDPARRERFEREAKAISSLNHPHICTLYDVGREGETDFLVMELVEGETLATRLEKGPLPSEQILQVAIQVADALDKAHRQGVLHRDLKPANVMLTKSGAKLLDFGLAKPMAIADSAATAMLTASKPLTREGTIVGTFQYMGPEQLEGKEADARSDIFSFGAVLYEMATGKKAFEGKTTASVIAAVLASEPAPISALQPMTPPTLERLVKTCLAKDPDERFQNAHDLTLQLKWLSEAGSLAGVPAPVVSRRKGRHKLAWGLAAAGLLLAAVFAAAYLRLAFAPEAARPIVSQISAPEKLKFAFTGPPTNGAPALSPDGTRMVFPANDEQGREALWVRPLDSLTAQRLEGTEQGTFPFWSPDSRYVGFFAGGKLKKINVAGGPAQSICDAPSGRGGSWNRDDVIVFAPEVGSGLSRVSAAGGTPAPVTHLQKTSGISSQRWPEFLPDGRHFIYWAGEPFSSDPSAVGIYLGALESSEQKLLFNADSNARFASLGHLLFLRGRNLMAQSFDADSLRLKGDAVPVAESVGSPQNYRLGLFSVSQNGLLVYQTGQDFQNQFVWFDENGKQLGTAGEPGILTAPKLSPDGHRLVYSAQDAESKKIDIWTMDLSRGVRTRFSFEPGAALNPLWSSDGSGIIFSSQRKGVPDLYIKNSSGAGDAEPLYESASIKIATDFSHDGRYLAFAQLDPKISRWAILVLPLFGDRKPFPFLQSSFNEMGASFSPDGHWLAYVSDESGTFEVYLAPFPGGGGKFEVSQGGGVQPQWKRDGSALVYLAGVKLMEVSLRFKGTAVEIGAPRQLFQMPSLQGNGPATRAYTVTPEGKRFLFTVLPQAFSPEPLTLITNWTAGLKK